MHIHIVKIPITLCIRSENIRMSLDHLLPGNFDDSNNNHMESENLGKSEGEKNIEMISVLKNELQPGVSCVLLKGKSKQCYFLVSHGVKKTVNYSVGESSPLILIHGNHLVPVSGNLG